MSLYEGIAIVLASSSIVLTLILWFFNRNLNLEERRQKFFQTLIEGFYTHNWKFIEHWDNEGIRPMIDTTKSIEGNAKEFGKRVVLLDHLNILFEVFLHKSILHTEDIDSFSCWAESWFDESKDQLKIIFNDGDLFPLDYIVWLRDTILVLKKEIFVSLMGEKLIKRINLYEKKEVVGQNVNVI